MGFGSEPAHWPEATGVIQCVGPGPDTRLGPWTRTIQLAHRAKRLGNTCLREYSGLSEEIKHGPTSCSNENPLYIEGHNSSGGRKCDKFVPLGSQKCLC